MEKNYYLIIIAIAVGLVLLAFCMTLSYQHMKIRESIIARAQRMGCKDVKKLEAALDEMLGPDLRAFGSATDAEFQKRLRAIFED